MTIKLRKPDKLFFIKRIKALRGNRTDQNFISQEKLGEIAENILSINDNSPENLRRTVCDWEKLNKGFPRSMNIFYIENYFNIPAYRLIFNNDSDFINFLIFDQNLTINEFDLISNKFIKRFAINQLKTKNIPKNLLKEKIKLSLSQKKKLIHIFLFDGLISYLKENYRELKKDPFPIFADIDLTPNNKSNESIQVRKKKIVVMKKFWRFTSQSLFLKNSLFKYYENNFDNSALMEIAIFEHFFDLISEEMIKKDPEICNEIFKRKSIVSISEETELSFLNRIIKFLNYKLKFMGYSRLATKLQIDFYEKLEKARKEYFDEISQEDLDDIEKEKINKTFEDFIQQYKKENNVYNEF